MLSDERRSIWSQGVCLSTNQRAEKRNSATFLVAENANQMHENIAKGCLWSQRFVNLPNTDNNSEIMAKFT